MSLPHVVHVCLSRQRALFASVLILCLGGVALLTFSLPKVYRASANLAVGGNRDITQGQRVPDVDEGLARTYAELLKTPPVEAAVRRALPFAVARGELAGKMSFEAVTGTTLVRVAAEDAAPTRAQTIANTYARTFVDQQRQQLRQTSRTTLRDLSARIGDLSRHVRALARAFARSGGDQTELRANRAELAAAVRSFTTTGQRAALNSSDLAVASSALAPRSPVRPRPAIYLLIGAIFSLILAATAAFARDAFDKRIRTEEELVEVLDAPVLTRVPEGAGARSRGQRVEDAFQLLRLNLQLSDPDGEIHTIAVLSPSRGDGKSTVVLGLAGAFALSGAEVMAVDCDLRNPALHGLFSVDGSEGISSVLAGFRQLHEVIRTTDDPGLSVLPAGPSPPSPSVLLRQGRLSEVLALLPARADYVIVDTPPVAFSAEAMAVAATADAAIIVADLGRTRRDSLVVARDQLEKAGARLVGVVSNRVPGGAIGYGWHSVRPERPEQPVSPSSQR